MKTCRKFNHEYSGRQCQACKNLAHKAWRERNPEKVKQNSSKYYAANKDAIIKSVDEWRRRNPEMVNRRQAEFRERNAAKISIYRKEWRLKNPNSVRSDKRNRRARLASAEGKLSQGISETLLLLQKYKCACCAANLRKVVVHLDHIVPLALGGRNDDSNVQLLCKRCNLSKGAKNPIVFMQQRGFLL